MLRRLHFLTVTACIALSASATDAGTINNPTRLSTEAISARHASKRRHTPKAAARKIWSKRGQQVIHSQRIREIQGALIREHYLNGRTNGVWDQRSRSAMARFQSDNGWQSKVVPDSRALIKLGLGPDHVGLINPDTAAITFIRIEGTPDLAATARP